MYILLLVVYTLTCILLILIVLLQSGKGASLSGLIGSSSGETIFAGGAGNVLLRKITASLAIIYIILALILTVISLRQPRQTVTDKIPITPTAPPPPPSSPGQ